VVYGLGVVVLILIATLILFQLKNKISNNRDLEQECVDISINSNNGKVVAVGNMDEFTITIENRYCYLVRGGIIVAFNDSDTGKGFKEYAEVK